jgi:hypothetical protein
MCIVCRSDHETDRGGGTTAEIQGAEAVGPVDLVVTGPVADTFGGVAVEFLPQSQPDRAVTPAPPSVIWLQS